MIYLFFSFQLEICIPVRMNHKCMNYPNRSCYICGNVVLPNCPAKINDFVKKAYRDNFGVKQGNQDKTFAADGCYKTYIEYIRVDDT